MCNSRLEFEVQEPKYPGYHPYIVEIYKVDNDERYIIGSRRFMTAEEVNQFFKEQELLSGLPVMEKSSSV